MFLDTEPARQRLDQLYPHPAYVTFTRSVHAG